MSVVKISSHAAEALSNVLSQLQGKPNFEDLLTVMVDPCQDVEDTLYDLVTERQLDTAEGVNLDQYGKVVGAARRGLSDENYRRYIRVRIQANRSNGQADVILDVVSFLVGGQVVDFIPAYPAAYVLQYETLGTDPDLVALMSEILEQTTAAGVAYTVVEGLTDEAKRFDVAGRGFDDGKFGDIIIGG